MILMTPAIQAHLRYLEPSTRKSLTTLEMLDRWAQSLDDFDRDFARDRARAKADEAPRAGLNVWVLLPRIDGNPERPFLVRGRLIKRNQLTGSWLVVNLDAPRAHFYIGADRIVPRQS